MQVTIREEPPVALVSIVGSVDSLTANDLQAAMASAVQKGQTRLVADFSGVEYTSSAGLRVIPKIPHPFSCCSPCPLIT